MGVRSKLWPAVLAIGPLLAASPADAAGTKKCSERPLLSLAKGELAAPDVPIAIGALKGGFLVATAEQTRDKATNYRKIRVQHVSASGKLKKITTWTTPHSVSIPVISATDDGALVAWFATSAPPDKKWDDSIHTIWIATFGADGAMINPPTEHFTLEKSQNPRDKHDALASAQGVLGWWSDDGSLWLLSTIRPPGSSPAVFAQTAERFRSKPFLRRELDMLTAVWFSPAPTHGRKALRTFFADGKLGSKDAASVVEERTFDAHSYPLPSGSAGHLAFAASNNGNHFRGGAINYMSLSASDALPKALWRSPRGEVVTDEAAETSAGPEGSFIAAGARSGLWLRVEGLVDSKKDGPWIRLKGAKKSRATRARVSGNAHLPGTYLITWAVAAKQPQHAALLVQCK